MNRGDHSKREILDAAGTAILCFCGALGVVGVALLCRYGYALLDLFNL